ncbi:hypothetical protein ABPG75_008323 [Micractinium tetrahymenae]
MLGQGVLDQQSLAMALWNSIMPALASAQRLPWLVHWVPFCRMGAGLRNTPNLARRLVQAARSMLDKLSLSLPGLLHLRHRAVNLPIDVKVDSAGNIYVLDYFNARVQKFDTSFNYVSQIGSRGSGNGQFQGPLSSCLDASDNLYVVDLESSNVQKFDPSGNFVWTSGTPGIGDGQAQQPSDEPPLRTTVYVGDRETVRVQLLSTARGAFLSKFTLTGGTTGATYLLFAGDGSLFASRVLEGTPIASPALAITAAALALSPAALTLSPATFAIAAAALTLSPAALTLSPATEPLPPAALSITSAPKPFATTALALSPAAATSLAPTAAAAPLVTPATFTEA